MRTMNWWDKSMIIIIMIYQAHLSFGYYVKYYLIQKHVSVNALIILKTRL